jgi:hypothetical protein
MGATSLRTRSCPGRAGECCGDLTRALRGAGIKRTRSTRTKICRDLGRDRRRNVCSGAGPDAPSRYYSPEFRDHDLAINVEEQIVYGNRVTSRFVAFASTGSRSAGSRMD